MSARSDAGSGAATGGEHVAALDGLRGLAVLFVMTYHYIAPFSFAANSGVTRKISTIASCLWTGVDVFFVLSGFLITGILLRAKDRPRYFTTFYMRRVLRIFPLYYGALVIIFLVIPCFVAIDAPAVKRIYESQGWLWAYSQDIAMVVHNEDYFNVDWLWIGHFWSLAVEEHFYLVWPLIVLVCSRRALLATILGLIVATPLLRGVLLAMGFGAPVVYPFTLCRLDELAMGALLAVLVTAWPHERLARLARWGLGGSLTYLVLVVAIRRKAFDWANWTMLGPGFSALAMASAAIVVFAIAPRETRLKRCLEARWLRTFGKYSYGAYVIHTPIEPVCLRYFPHERIARLAEGLGFTASRVAGVLGFAVLGIGVTMTLAIVSYHAFERPFLKLKRHFEYRSSTADAAPAHVVASTES